ncbi:MAG: sigma-E factor negative regulatory protein [Burkholderiales bacterium]
MSSDSERDAAALERLSALVDGELDGDAAGQACGHWRESGEARSSWHVYHVIGDVLRSDDLACDPARDAGFLEALRARLKDEPVVLAPRPLPQSARVADGARSGRWSWKAPTAVAAGFVAVVGVLMLTRGPSSDASAPAASLVSVAPAAQPMPASMTAAAPMTVANEPSVQVATGKVIRDARLDRYLTAHKQFAGSSALGVPSGFLRNATAIENDR